MRTWLGGTRRRSGASRWSCARRTCLRSYTRRRTRLRSAGLPTPRCRSPRSCQSISQAANQRKGSSRSRNAPHLGRPGYQGTLDPPLFSSLSKRYVLRLVHVLRPCAVLLIVTLAAPIDLVRVATQRERDARRGRQLRPLHPREEVTSGLVYSRGGYTSGLVYSCCGYTSGLCTHAAGSPPVSVSKLRNDIWSTPSHGSSFTNPDTWNRSIVGIHRFCARKILPSIS